MARKPTADVTTISLDHGLNTQARSIHISGELDEASVSKYIRGIEILCLSSLDPIVIYITSNGGDVEAGFGLYDAIATCQAHVTGVVLGSAQSMAAILLQAADKKIISASSTFMLHFQTVSIEADAASFNAWSGWNKRTIDLFSTILAEKTKKPKSFWLRNLKADYILTAERAIELGLVDKILTTFPYRDE